MRPRRRRPLSRHHSSFFSRRFLFSPYLCNYSAQYPTLLLRVRTPRFDSARSESPPRRLRNPPRFVIVTQFRGVRARDEICSTTPRLRTLSARVLPGYLRYFGIAEYRLFEENTRLVTLVLLCGRKYCPTPNRCFFWRNYRAIIGTFFEGENRTTRDIYGTLTYSMGNTDCLLIKFSAPSVKYIFHRYDILISRH